MLNEDINRTIKDMRELKNENKILNNKISLLESLTKESIYDTIKKLKLKEFEKQNAKKMKYSFRNISTKKYGVRTQLTVNIKSLENPNLFSNCMHKFTDKTGRSMTKGVFHSLIPSTRNFKYLYNGNIDETEDLFNKVKKNYLYIDFF